MYAAILAVLANLLVLVFCDTAMDVAGLPTCAQSCLSNATTAQGSCSSVDIKCLCSNIGYINALSCCLSQSCSTSDQQKALSFDAQLCNNVNVTIPNFVGCALSSSSSSSAMSGMSSMTTMTSGMGMMTMPSGTVASTLSTVEVLITTTTGAPVARFTGGMLLMGTCTVPQVASITLSSGGTLEFPWLGCAAAAPNCCPWQNSQGGALTICPMDYFTTANACCPSGWSVYTSAFAGQTPCYTSPPLPLVPPSNTAKPSALVSVISNELFALKYDLVPAHKGLNPGAKAGIAIGAIAGVAFLAFLAFCILRARNRHAAAAQRSHLDTATDDDLELPGPPDERARARSEKYLGIPPPVASSSAPPVTQVQAPELELPGSTYIHEHHPAYGVGEGFGPGVQPVEGGYPHTSHNGNLPSHEEGVETPSTVISPMEGPRQ